MYAVPFAALERLGDAGMVECRRGLGFELEPGDVIGIAGEISRQDFQRDVAIHLAVERLPDGGHAARADRLDQLERPDLLSGNVCRGKRRMRCGPIRPDNGRCVGRASVRREHGCPGEERDVTRRKSNRPAERTCTKPSPDGGFRQIQFTGSNTCLSNRIRPSIDGAADFQDRFVGERSQFVRLDHAVLGFR